MFERDDFYADDRRRAHAEWRRPEEIERAAAAVARALLAGLPIEVVLAPGNGTRYTFLFFRARANAADYVTERECLSSGSAGTDPVWVVYAGDYRQAAYPLDLMRRTEPPAPGYLAEKWSIGAGGVTEDTFVLEALLAEVGRRTGG